MVLDVDGEALLLDPGRRSLGNRPALERPVQLQPQIEVHVGRPVLLDDESGGRRNGTSSGRRRPLAKGLRGAGGVPLLAVLFELGTLGRAQGTGLGANLCALKQGARRSDDWTWS